MKWIDKYGFKLLFSLIILNCLIFIYGFATDSPRQSRFQNAYNVSCSIRDNAEEIHGSGALLSNGLVLTAAHVLDNDNNDIITSDEKIVQVHFGIGLVTTGVAIYSGRPNYVPGDFALLEINKQPSGVGFEITREWPVLGDRLYTISCPDGKDLQLTDGLFTAKETNKGVCSVSIFPGSSGAAIFNEQQEIVGIVSRIGNSLDTIMFFSESGHSLLSTNNYIPHQNFYAPSELIVDELKKELRPRKCRGWTMVCSLPVVLAFYFYGRKTFLA